MMSFEIIPAFNEKDLDEKGYVHWKSWQETYSNMMPNDFLSNITLEKCVIMAHKQPQNTLLLKVDGRVVGFSCYKESMNSELANELIALYLLKEYHGQKLGYALLNATIKKMKNGRDVLLWVLKGNDRAIRFYKRCGFVFTGKEKNLPFGTEIQMAMKLNNKRG